MELSSVQLGICIVFVIILIAFICRRIENRMLQGFWRASDDFCHEAQLKMFLLYIGEQGWVSNCRYGYFFVVNGNGIILNNPVYLSLSYSFNLLPTCPTVKTYNVSVDWQDNPPESENAFPSEFQMSYYPLFGKIVLHDQDKVLATLWKDQQTSALTIDAELMPDEMKEKIETGEDIESWI